MHQKVTRRKQMRHQFDLKSLNCIFFFITCCIFSIICIYSSHHVIGGSWPCYVLAYSHVRNSEARIPDNSPIPRNKVCNSSSLRNFKNHTAFQRVVLKPTSPNSLFEQKYICYMSFTNTHQGCIETWIHIVDDTSMAVCNLSDVPVLPRCLPMPFM